MAKVVTPLNEHNTCSNFYPSNDFWRMELKPIAASVAMVVGTALASQTTSNTTSGNYIKMPTANTNGQNFSGILVEPIVATDSDYATAGKLKNVWVPTSPAAKAFFTADTTITAASVWRMVQFGSGSITLTTTLWAWAIIRNIISSTLGECSFDVPQVVQS